MTAVDRDASLGEPSPMQKLILPVSNEGGKMRAVTMYLPVPTLTQAEWERMMEILFAMKPGLVRP